MASSASTSSPATARSRAEDAAAFQRRMRWAAGAALVIHALVTFAIPRTLPTPADLDAGEPAATQVELVGPASETPEATPPPTPTPPPAEPTPKPEPLPKPEPDPIAPPEPPKPVEPPPPTPPAPKPKPQPAPEKKAASAAKRTESAPTTGSPGASGGAAGTDSGKGSRPGYLYKPAPKYPPESEAAREHGTVKLAVQIDATGRPESVNLKSSSGYPRLDRAAMEAVRRWRFKPATREDGKPISALVEIPVQFRLP